MLDFSGVCSVKSYLTFFTQIVLDCLQPAAVPSRAHYVCVPDN